MECFPLAIMGIKLGFKRANYREMQQDYSAKLLERGKEAIEVESSDVSAQVIKESQEFSPLLGWGESA